MPITQESLKAFLKCPRKAYLVSDGAIGAQSPFHEWQRHSEEKYKEAASAHLRSCLRPGEWFVGTLPADRLHERCYRLVFDYTITEPDVYAQLQALEVVCPRLGERRHSYIPIRFYPREKLTALDRLLLAFDAFAFSRATGELPTVGKIVHGQRYLAVRIALPKLIRTVRSIIAKIAKQQAEPVTPLAVLNKHCAECQFQSACRQIACEKDDLSLLP